MQHSDFSEPKNLTLVIILYVVSGLGLLGSSFTIITFLLFRDARNNGTSLIFCLAISDFCLSFAHCFFWMWFDHTSFVVCNIQGALLMFGLCASLFWGLMIGCYMFLVFYKNIEVERIARYKYLFHLFAWGYGLCGAVIPVYLNQYGIMYPGSDGNKLSFCWIKSDTSLFRLYLYIPDTAIFFLLIILYGVIQYHLRRTQKYFAKIVCKKMSIYLLTYAIINFFAVVNRIQNYFFNNEIFALFLLQFATQLLQGFLNAFAYAWNEPAFRENYRNMFAKLRPTNKNSIQYEEETQRILVAETHTTPL